MLRILSAKKQRAFYESQLKREHEVLFESENKNGFIQGYSANYLRVKLPYSADLVNTRKRIFVDRFDDEGMLIAQEQLPVSHS